MSILTRIVDYLWAAPPTGAFAVREGPWGAQPIAYQIGKPVWPTRDVGTYSKGYDTAPLIYRCVNVTANAIGSAPLRVYLDAGGEPKEQIAHPVRRLMERPNLAMGEGRFFGIVAMTMAVTGFCLVEKERSSAGRVVGLWPLRSHWCKPIARAYASPDWEYKVPGHSAVVLPSEDVMVVPYADHPDGRYTGIGAVEAALREVGISDVMTGFLKAFFDGGAMPMYGLVPDKDAGQLTQAQADAVKSAWMQRYGGLNRSVEPAILQGITDVKRLGFDFNELAYPDLRDIADVAICQAFGVSPMLVDAPIGLKHSTYSNKQEARRGFYEDTISPLWARIDDALTFGLLPEFETRPGYYLGFDTSALPAFQEDENATWARATAGLQSGGITVNQFQRAVGMAGFGPAGDVLLHSLATIAVPVREANARRADDAPVTVREIVDRAPLAIASRVNRDAIATRSRQTVAKLGDKGAPLLRRFFAGQADRIVAAAKRSAPGGIELRAIEQIDWDDEAERLAEVVRRLHTVAGELAFGAAGDALGLTIDWSLANPNIGRTLKYLIERADGPRGMTATTRADVSRVVTDALDEGVSMPDLADRLRGLFEETYRGRSEAIARTESQVSYNTASTLGYAESGVVAQVELLDNPAHDTDPGSDGLTCAQRNGLVVLVSEAQRHIEAEHPNGTLAVSPVLSTPLGEG